jgi:hypothetical protein
MKANAKFYFVPVGRPSKGVRVKLCKIGYAKLQKHSAKVQYKKAEGKVHSLRNPDKQRIKRQPYIRARYLDWATGKEVRPELGRWLLDSEIPVAHINGDLLDFRLKNLLARETPRQEAVHKRAAEKRAKREERSVRWAAKRAADHARRPEKEPDGLTPEEQVTTLGSPEFQHILRRIAGRYVRERIRRSDHPADEIRAPEIVAEIVQEVTAASLGRIRKGLVRNVRAYASFAVQTQARKPEKRGHVK